jgi:hypothetical protein
MERAVVEWTSSIWTRSRSVLPNSKLARDVPRIMTPDQNTENVNQTRDEH